MYHLELIKGHELITRNEMVVFLADPDAELVYFYLPIAITLVANLVLLLTSKYARLFKLKKLEKNKPKIPSKCCIIN